MTGRSLRLGHERVSDPTQPLASTSFELPPHHLVTHGVVVGMTGSGKTGLTIVLIEEALAAGVPTLVIDLKGDLPNLLLAFPDLAAADFLPWIDGEAAARAGRTPEEAARATAEQWRSNLAAWGLGPADVARHRASFAPRLITPGARIAEPMDVMSSLSRRSPLWDDDEEAALDQLSAGVSLLLRLAGRDGDARGRDHVVLVALAERRIRAGAAAPLAELLGDVLEPPIATIGAMPFDDFMPERERTSLAQDLNALLASPKLASWLSGAPLDVAAWLAPQGGKTALTIVSVAHLDDDERQLVLGLLLDEVLAWTRSLSGTSDLRALVVFDEVYGYLPPHPHNPPTKKPLLTLLKQARAFGVGLVVCTQNPMDLDYKALSNAGAWFVGRLQTDADRERVVEGLTGSDGGLGGLDPAALGSLLRNLPPRSFFVRDVHRKPPCAVVETRSAMSWMRGPMTRRELAKLYKVIAPGTSAPPQPVDATAPALGAPASPSAPTPPTPTGHAPDPGGAGPPAPPPGWKVAFVGASAPAGLVYAPFVAATVLVRVRDTKLGVAAERTHAVVAPLDGSARPDLERTRAVDPRSLAGPQAEAPAAGARFLPLPPSLGTKKAAQAAERSMRDFVAARFPIEVLVHRSLGLDAAPGEDPTTFAGRCRVEAERRAVDEQHQVANKLAPKIAKLEQKLTSLHRDVDGARQAAASGPGDLGAALLRAALGRSGAAFTQARGKANDKLARAESEYGKAYAALESARAEQNAALVAARDRWSREAGQIETARMLPKKGDVEVTAMTLVWFARSRDDQG